MGFEFNNEDEARDCIERVSVLYKRLKSNYQSDQRRTEASSRSTT
jgi:hypothetical protein